MTFRFRELVLICLWLPTALTFPHNQFFNNASDLFAHASLIPRAVPGLKVLCVGDSITVGVADGNPDLQGKNNGYRLDLYNLLSNAGINAEFVGTQISGTNNPQPRMEGYGGQTINTILSNIQSNGIMSERPNLVLIHAGTNDNDLPQNSDDPSILYADAPYRLGNLIDYVLCQDPNAVVLVAKLIQNKYNQAQTNAFNDQVPVVVGQRYMKGFKVRVVDMSMIGGNELSDFLHPVAAGYADMANRWYAAIENIPADWWSTVSGSSSSQGGPLLTCDRNSISFSPAIDGNLLALGFHVNGDSPDPASQPESQGNVFTPGWGDNGVIALGTGNPGGGVIFADLDGDGRQDYVWANYSAGSEGSIHAWLNGGVDAWGAVNNGDAIAWGQPGTSYIELADLDGDKKADYILIANGQFKIWQNGGPNGQVWNWNSLPNAEAELNYIFENAAPFHWFADINGDGRADLIVEDGNSVLDFYLNDGPDGNGGFAWTQCKAKGIATGTLIWADIDGDGKADYVSGDSDGGLTGWLNNYSGGCDIAWIPINGRTPKSLALGTGAPIGNVRLADFTGDAKADYLTVSDDIGTVHLYPNLGSMHPPESPGLGGFGAAVRLNDMDGDGRDDHVSVTDYSGIAVYLNGGQGSGDTWIWNQQADGNVIALGFPDATRSEVHLADMNGDGRDDYLVIDTATGAIHCYLNLGPGTSGSWNWNIMGEIAIGVGGVGAGVRIADFDGDGRADYTYLAEDSSARVWLNRGPGNSLSNWQIINGGAVAALGVGANRQDVYFADIDGDGKSDYCWIHPDTGDLQVWYNLWDGHSVGWLNGGTIISGQGYPGQNIRLGRLGTSGRHDYVAVNENDGSFKAWLNQCGNVIGTATRAIAGSCGNAPMPTQSTTEPLPSPQVTPVSVDGAGQTIVQGSNGVQVTLPTGIAAPTTITSNGITFSFIPGGNTVGTTFTNSAGQTIVQDSMGAQITLTPGVTTPQTITQTDGQVVTFNPSPGQNAAPTTTSTSTIPVGIIFPISTSVPAPTSTNGASVIPCRLWFFFVCISWIDIHIEAWEFEFPIGIRPPGPPPPINIPGIKFSTIGPLPPWPEITIGTDHIPTPKPEPDNCETQTGSICLTVTSSSVSAQSTITSVLSSCFEVLGCEATDSATTTTTVTTAPACAYGYSDLPTPDFYTPASTTAVLTTPQVTSSPPTQATGTSPLPNQATGASSTTIVTGLPVPTAGGDLQLTFYEGAGCTNNFDATQYPPSNTGSCQNLDDSTIFGTLYSVIMAGSVSSCRVEFYSNTGCNDADLVLNEVGTSSNGVCFTPGSNRRILSYQTFNC